MWFSKARLFLPEEELTKAAKGRKVKMWDKKNVFICEGRAGGVRDLRNAYSSTISADWYWTIHHGRQRGRATGGLCKVGGPHAHRMCTKINGNVMISQWLMQSQQKQQPHTSPGPSDYSRVQSKAHRELILRNQHRLLPSTCLGAPSNSPGLIFSNPRHLSPS